MGIYIETGGNHGKAVWLASNKDVSLIVPNEQGEWPTWEALREHYPNQVPVCVVDNGVFEAAGVAYDESEYYAFHQPDGRPKIWLLVKESDVEELTGINLDTYRMEKQQVMNPFDGPDYEEDIGALQDEGGTY